LAQATKLVRVLRCFYSVGGGIFMSKPNDKNNNPKRSGMIFIGMGGFVILFTKSFKGV